MAISYKHNSPYKISIFNYSKLLFSGTQSSYNNDSSNLEIIEGHLWTGNMNGAKKIMLFSLKDMEHVKSLGGARVHDLVNCNNAFGGKLVWHMYSKPLTKWCQNMQQKYLDKN